MSTSSRSKSIGWYLLILGLAGGFGFTPPASAQEITVSTSGQYSSGDYIFSEPTDMFVWTNGVSVIQGRFRAGVNVPLLVRTTPWVSYGGIGLTPSGGPHHAAVGGNRQGVQRRRSHFIALPDTGSYRTTGLGDPQFHGSYALFSPSDTSQFGIQLTGTVKPPLADVDAGFGTGAWDKGIGLSVFRSGLPWFVLLEGTYWWLGDLDALPLKNGVAYSVGVGRSLYEGRWGLLASLTGSTAIIEDIDPPVALTGGMSFSPGDWGLSVTASSGLTEGAADWSVGLAGFFTVRM